MHIRLKSNENLNAWGSNIKVTYNVTPKEGENTLAKMVFPLARPSKKHHKGSHKHRLLFEIILESNKKLKKTKAAKRNP